MLISDLEFIFAFIAVEFFSVAIIACLLSIKATRLSLWLFSVIGFNQILFGVLIELPLWGFLLHMGIACCIAGIPLYKLYSKDYL